MAKKKAAVAIRSRNQEIRKVRVCDLEDAPFNFRRHSEMQATALNGAIDEIGFFGYPDVFVTEEGRLQLCDGHLRKNLIIRKYGADAMIEVNVTDFSEAEAKKATLTKDPIAAMADTDLVALRSLMADADFQDKSVLRMLGVLEEEASLDDPPPGLGEITEDEPPPVPEKPITKPGDMWLLGDHRLLCGDCTDPAVMKRLMGGKLADMTFTDPPYNVAYVGGTKEALTIQNDQMSGDDFLTFLRNVFKAIASGMRPGGVIYVCHADSEGLRFRQAFIDAGFLLKQCLIWVKSSLVLGRQDYQWRHEPILYGWLGGAGHSFYGGRKNTTVIEPGGGVTVEDVDGGHILTLTTGGRTVVVRVPSYDVVLDGTDELESTWRFDKPSRNAEHPTMKPVALCARAIDHGTKRREIVLDTFLGSGSTLIAAEQMGRRCYGTEIDPRYADVVKTRWEALTGQVAVLAPRDDLPPVEAKKARAVKKASPK